MKKAIIFSIFFILLTSSYVMAQSVPSSLTGPTFKPHKSINKTEFTKQYQANKDYWDKAFAFLKNTNLDTISVGRYAIDGDNVYAMITENKTKDLDSTKWESHRSYIDLQMVIKGEEKIGVTNMEKLTVTMPYDASKDLINYSGDGKFYEAKPYNFFLFFPQDAHRPNVTTNGNQPDKKIVIKIRYAAVSN